MADKKPSKEQYAVFKKRAKDKSISAEAREKFQMLVDKFADDFKEAEKEVEKAVKGTSKKYKKLPKPSKKVLIKIDREGDESNRNKLKEMGYNPSEVDKLSMGDANTIVEDLEKSKKTTPKKRGRKPKAKQTEQSADDIAKAKAEIKKRTGKTEEQCESIIEEYKALRSKAQTRKKKETKAKEDNKKRVTQLKKEDKVIEGTNEKTAEATIEKVSENIGKKIEKEIEKVEKEVKKDETAKAKKEVDKKSPKKSATEKKKEVEKKVEAKVEKKVKEKTKVVVKKVIIDTSSMLKSIAESLGNFDKDSQKEFLMKLRSDIDKLLSKYMYGGEVAGATQQLDITQSNLSASSVNPSKFERGGGIDGQNFRSAVIWAKGDIYENYNYEDRDLNIQHDLMSDYTDLYEASLKFGIYDEDDWREIYEVAFEEMGIENPPQFAKGGKMMHGVKTHGKRRPKYMKGGKMQDMMRERRGM